MPKLKTVYATQEDIPAGFEELYTERNSQFELTGIEGVKTQADLDRVQGALVKERTDHKATKEKYQPIADLDLEDIRTKVEGFDSLTEQLEALKAAGATPSEEQLEPIIKARVNQALGPIERQNVQLTRKVTDTEKKLAEKETEIGSLKTSITSGTIDRSVRDSAVAEKVLSTALADVVRASRGLFEIEEGTNKPITKDGVGVTAGLSPKEWLAEMKDEAPHWWPVSVGSGARGGGGGPGSYVGADNPWSKEGWNVTKQGQLVRTLGADKATDIAAKAGAKLGDTKPKAA